MFILIYILYLFNYVNVREQQPPHLQQTVKQLRKKHSFGNGVGAVIIPPAFTEEAETAVMRWAKGNMGGVGCMLKWNTKVK